MGIFGSNIDLTIINEKDVPASTEEDQEAGYGLDDDEDAANQSAATDEDDPNYDLPDDEEPPAEDDPPAEDEEDPNYDLPEDEEDDTTGEEPTGEEDPAGGGEEGESNYDLPTDGDDTEGDTGEGETDPGEEGETEEEPTEEDEEDPIKAIDAEIFQDLSDEEKVIRDKALYENYKDLYSTINDFIGKIGKIPRNGNTLYEMEFISSKASELRELVYNYILNNYSIKTYIDNQKSYYEFITIFANINKMLEELGEKDEEK